jgi:dTDP-4-dehydrorhamnose reductase
MLLGRLNAQHPMWGWLTAHGLSPEDLDLLVAEPCPPAVVGINYYVTSDRFLDHRLERYPESTHGGNGEHRYADLEAVRVRREGIYGHAALLRECDERYHLPLAITEAHLGCTREEQVRWLLEAWQGALSAREAGADVRAVTAWALLGCTDWDSLVTRSAGHYEPGAFDVRSPTPRRTALGSAIRDLAAGGVPKNPAVHAPGWWQKPSRLLIPPTPQEARARNSRRSESRPILIAGATGKLGRALAQACAQRGLEYRLLRREDLDIASSASVESALARYRPWALLNAAGYARVDDAEHETNACFRDNTTGPVTLATVCNGLGVALVTFSSDLVFDGRKGSAYVESDRPNPLGVYGRSKAEAEWRVLTTMPRALVVRTSAFFGADDPHNFIVAALRALSAGQAFRAAGDVVLSPTYVPDLAQATLDLLVDGEHGTWHLANEGALSWADLARAAATAAGLDAKLIEACPASELGWCAPRPSSAVLASERARLMPSLDDALGRLVRAQAVLMPAETESLKVSS